MIYELAKPEDIQAVYNVVQHTIKTIYPKYYPMEVVDFFSEHHSEDAIEKDIKNGYVSVLKIDGTIVATGCFVDDHITRAYVLPEHQKKGYGTFIMKNIEEHEAMLRKYAIEKMKELDNIEIYNENGVGPIAFNIKNVFSQDGASLFNTYGIAIRAGQHCAKILDEYLHVSQTLRASFYFYNTKEEIDQFIEVCKKGDDFLDAFFG